jgi:hypothetical protein
VRLHLSHDTVRLAQALLDQGWSLRRSARQLRLSPRTLDRLLRKTPPSDSADSTGDPSAIPDDPFSQARRRAKRCPGCGGLVFHWPCLTCERRAKAERDVALKRAA